MTIRPEPPAELEPRPPDELEAEPDLSIRRRLLKPQTLLSFVAVAAIVYFVSTRFDLDLPATWAQIRSANPLLYVLAFFVYYLGFPLRGTRWRLLLGNAAGPKTALPSVLTLSRILYLGWFANCLVVAKLGDVFRAYLLKQRTGVSLSRTFGTILAERVVDMIVLFILLSLSALTVLSRLENGRAGSTILILVVGFGFVLIIAAGLALMYHGGSLIERLIPARFQAAYLRFSQGTLASFKRLPLLGLLTVAVWCSEAGSLYLISLALGIRVALPMVIFVALAGSLLTTVPGLPGGLALVEGGMAGALSLVLTGPEALSVAILYRTISYWSLVGLGAAAYLLTMHRNRPKVAPSEARS